MSWCWANGRRALGCTAHTPLYPDPGGCVGTVALDAPDPSVELEVLGKSSSVGVDSLP